MKILRFDVFENRLLRLFDGKSITPQAERALDAADVSALIGFVEKNYRQTGGDLPGVGRRLYDWLDGPAERWLADALNNSNGHALHIDVEERLRGLPWELLHDGKRYLSGTLPLPLTPVRRVRDACRDDVRPENRPLRILMMACSPDDVKPVLDYEGEEAILLGATAKQPIELVVEESGSLIGLQERVEAFGRDYFDVLHLSGHADVLDNEPVFLVEQETGGHEYATADKIAQAIIHWPRLVFLSGCKTG
jgi:CHAT domain-containing protein